MYKVTFKTSVLMAGIVFSTAALACDTPAAAAPGAAAPAAAAPAPAAPAVAAPAAAVEASAAMPMAPVAGAAEAPKAEEKEPVLAAADALALLKKSNCLVCHSVEKKIVGPAYRDVAAKYRGQPDAEAKLFAKVTTGGKGVWGSTPMPPQTAKREDIRSMIKFVLAIPPTNIAKSN